MKESQPIIWAQEMLKYLQMSCLLNKDDKQPNNIFVWGLSRSGKTTISEYIRDKYNYLMLRQAGTIKNILCDKYKTNIEGLEELKSNPHINIRKQHYQVGEMIAKFLHNHTKGDFNVTEALYDMSIAYNIIQRNHPIFESLRKSDDYNVLVSDVRSLSTALLFLKAGWTGIFLTRRLEEEITSHFTDVDIMRNGMLEDSIKELDIATSNIHIIHDSDFNSSILSYIPESNSHIIEDVNGLLTTADSIVNDVNRFLLHYDDI